MDLIESAQHSLDISYYAMQGGETVDLFHAHLLAAADRGVQVRFLIDGIFHNMRFGQRDIIRVFNEHPNMELSFYEPLDLARPWTWHNRLHDKFIVADQAYVLIGGRNIGDKYFAPDDYQGVSQDRDVLIFNENQQQSNLTSEISDYFDYLWSHEFTVLQTNKDLTRWGKRRATAEKINLETCYESYQASSRDQSEQMNPWRDQAHQINGGFFVHNSIERFYKQPDVWLEMLVLIEQAEQQALVQSPYIIPSRLIREDLDKLRVDIDDGMLLTNALAATPNIMAHSGYRNHRQTLAGSDLSLYEFQRPDQSLHMKSMVIDQQITAVGSFNFDARSAFLNTESMVVIDSPGLADEIITLTNEEYLSNSLLVNQGETDSTDQLESTPLTKHIMTLVIRPLARLIEFLL
nr:phosphatidylserine/phosphatidylglycerophosphate/cardiolipin synthase family protein [Amphibacillus cookii]